MADPIINIHTNEAGVVTSCRFQNDPEGKLRKLLSDSGCDISDANVKKFEREELVGYISGSLKGLVTVSRSDITNGYGIKLTVKLL